MVAPIPKAMEHDEVVALLAKIMEWGDQLPGRIRIHLRPILKDTEELAIPEDEVPSFNLGLLVADVRTTLIALGLWGALLELKRG